MTGPPALRFAVSIATTPIDDFLAGGGDSSGGERWETLGFGLALAGVVLTVGIVVFLACVHRGSRAEIRRFILVARACGALTLIGGGVEVAGTAAVLDIGWADAFTDGAASSAMMRLLAGVLVLVGLGEDVVPVGERTDHAAVELLASAEPDHRWVPGAASAFGVVGVGLGSLAFALDGHTTSEGPRALHAAVDVVHVVAGGVWAGGVLAVTMLAVLRRQDGAAGIGATVVRFSSVATVALIGVLAAGVVMAWMILGDVGDLVDTDWGRRLLVKVGAVVAAALLGGYNRIVLVPRLANGSTAAARTVRATLMVETVLLTFVIVVTVFLTRAAIV